MGLAGINLLDRMVGIVFLPFPFCLFAEQGAGEEETGRQHVYRRGAGSKSLSESERNNMIPEMYLGKVITDGGRALPLLSKW